MVDLDAGDFGEGAGQHLGFVLVRGDGFGHHADLVDPLGFEFGRGVDEPFHLGHLLVLGQRRRLELRIDPLLRFRLAGPCP
ncbi:hypothetical protein D3C85_1553820 [compost metagenome]